MKKQQKNQAGFIVSAELVLIATILVIGLIVGMVAIRDALTAEMGDVAEAIGKLDQSYYFEGLNDTGTNAAVAGSTFNDEEDSTCGGDGCQGDAGDAIGINFNVPPGNTEEVF